MAYHQPSTKSEEECVQWMWILVIDLLCMGGAPARNDFSSMLQLQLRYPEFRSVEAVLVLSKKFLWAKAMTESVQSYWRDVTF
jgi:hypothetical protein